MSVTTYLMGGCANQMFQYATGLALARRMNTEFYIDPTRYDAPNEHRMYSLHLFASAVGYGFTSIREPVIREQGLPYNPKLFESLSGDVSIYGYWQTEKYFAELKDELAGRFMPGTLLTNKHREIERQISAAGDRSCFLTIRRTDYVGNDFHGLLPMNYYLRAAGVIASRVSDPHFFVFSDDPEWCRENFKLPYAVTIAGNFDRTVKPHLGREDAELWLMRQCQHAIMANSSYSWWGAWLGADAAGGTVIAPKNWFGPAAKEDPRDIIPERWIKL